MTSDRKIKCEESSTLESKEFFYHPAPQDLAINDEVLRRGVIKEKKNF